MSPLALSGRENIRFFSSLLFLPLDYEIRLRLIVVITWPFAGAASLRFAFLPFQKFLDGVAAALSQELVQWRAAVVAQSNRALPFASHFQFPIWDPFSFHARTPTGTLCLAWRTFAPMTQRRQWQRICNQQPAYPEAKYLQSTNTCFSAVPVRNGTSEQAGNLGRSG